MLAPSRSSDVRAQILGAATRLFAAQGFEGTSLQDVAEEVGIRKPSLLYHFASKDELRQAVLRELLAHWKETLP
ncbi:MAG TPA: helix-turn-helix domain-containing protein, partial [Polyangiaceae bacterium]|nr:helix-turn-helix domain-containing protein [Polyangiaceae bacterium]